MSEPSICQAARLSSAGWSPACGRPAVSRYTNGDYQRLECAEHAEMTAGFLRPSDDPRAPQIVPLVDAAEGGQG